MRLLHLFVGISVLSTALGESFDKEFRKAHTQMYSDVDVDEEKTVCEALINPSAGDEKKYKVSLEADMPYVDVIKMTVWNMKYALKKGRRQIFKGSKDLTWRRNIINEIFGIFVKGCPVDYVPEGFLNVLKEFIMIYYNSLKTHMKEDIPRWNNTLQVLKNCREKSKPLPLAGVGLVLDTIALGDETLHVFPPRETADSIPDLDIIVDQLWWLFSFSFGTCYSPAGYRSSWAPKYKKLFYEDFMVPLLNRWDYAGPAANFGVMFGNYDLSNVLANIRVCVTAAYTALGIADRQLVRPIKFGPPNSKTGDSVID